LLLVPKWYHRHSTVPAYMMIYYIIIMSCSRYLVYRQIGCAACVMGCERGDVPQCFSRVTPTGTYPDHREPTHRPPAVTTPAITSQVCRARGTKPDGSVLCRVRRSKTGVNGTYIVPVKRAEFSSINK